MSIAQLDEEHDWDTSLTRQNGLADSSNKCCYSYRQFCNKNEANGVSFYCIDPMALSSWCCEQKAFCLHCSTVKQLYILIYCGFGRNT